MTTKHTPGPWRPDDHPLDVENACHCLCEGEGTSREWGAVAIGNDDEGYEHVAYCHPDNIPLISAAPDMASEISKQIDWLKHARSELAGVARPSLIMGFDQSIKHLTAVLAKARGEG